MGLYRTYLHKNGSRVYDRKSLLPGPQSPFWNIIFLYENGYCDIVNITIYYWRNILWKYYSFALHSHAHAMDVRTSVQAVCWEFDTNIKLVSGWVSGVYSYWLFRVFMTHLYLVLLFLLLLLATATNKKIIFLELDFYCYEISHLSRKLWNQAPCYVNRHVYTVGAAE